MADSSVSSRSIPILHRRSSAGIIRNVRMENFMCHSHLQIELGEWVNFITGQNGSKPLSLSLSQCVYVFVSIANFLVNYRSLVLNWGFCIFMQYNSDNYYLFEFYLFLMDYLYNNNNNNNVPLFVSAENVFWKNVTFFSGKLCHFSCVSQ